MANAQRDCAEVKGGHMREVCENCGAAMRLLHILPGQPGQEVRTWRCPACREEKITGVRIG